MSARSSWTCLIYLQKEKSVKCDTLFGKTFSNYDTSSGVKEFVRKLVKRFREQWASECGRYDEQSRFTSSFLRVNEISNDLARMRNDPNLLFESSSTRTGHRQTLPAQRSSNKNGLPHAYCQTTVSAEKTEVKCPIHRTSSNHLLKNGMKFC